jgi:hypothetical protein
MKTMRISTLAATLVAVAAMASAQIGGGHSGISTEWSFGGRIAFDELNAFGQCFASKQGNDALKLISTEPGSVEEARVYKQLFSNEQACLGDLAGLNVPWQYVRGAVAEGYYTRHLAVPPKLALPRDLEPAKVQPVMDAATCYAGKHPADATALIATKPASKEQAAVLDAHWTEFEACLPANMPAGYKFDTLLLRYRIAEALWREGWGQGG